MNKKFHIPVLLKEVVTNLQITPGKLYIDATLGGGGHTIEMTEHGGIILGIDCDLDALNYVSERITNYELRVKNNIKLVQGNFRDIDTIAKENGFEKVHGILFDLGVSSHQLDMGERGFSFLKNAELDMRMDRNLGVKARDLLGVLSKNELEELFRNFGEEPRATHIASAIVRLRKIRPIGTTGELAALILEVYGHAKGKIHPGTKVFQALRIAVNDELFSIKEAIPKGFGLLEKGGRMGIISFHSLEDRIVKEQFKKLEELGVGRLVNKKPIVPTEAEVLENPRCRSSKLRVIEKL